MAERNQGDLSSGESAWLGAGRAKRSYSYLPVLQHDESTEHIANKNEKLDRQYFFTRLTGIILATLGSFVLLFLFASSIWMRPQDLAALSDPTPQQVPIPYKTVPHPEPPSPLWGSQTVPFPTGAFWTNLVVGNGDGPIGAYPYGIKTLDVGIQVSYGASRRIVSKQAITDHFVADLQLSAVQPNAAHSVEKHDKLSVTVGYRTVAGGKYHTDIVKSSPFVTVVYENAAPMITSTLMHILSMEAQTVPGSAGVQYILTLGNYQKWLLYCSEPLALSLTGDTISSLTPIRGYIRVAILPLQNPLAAFATLMQYVRRYPTGAVVQLQYPSERAAVVRIQYNTVGDGALLMLALPHHDDVMVEPALDREENVRAQAALSPLWCIKGKLKAVVGTVWRLQYNLTQVGWNYIISDKLPTSRLDEVGVSLSAEVLQLPPTAQDPYSFGKQMQRLAALALLADNLGIADARRSAIATLEQAFTPWLVGTNNNPFVYDATYGGVVTAQGLADKNSDFGAGWYNDHHFHYGYLIYAAAVIAKLDAPYFADLPRKAAVDALVRDICNRDDSDPQFPFARHKDLFDGHSWASGLTQQGNGKGQESSSEAVNAYYAVYLYALAMQDAELQRFASTMLTMEVVSAQSYWHVRDASTYDAVFAASGMVGNVGALDVTASTWFGNNPEFVHGINLMPISPVTAVLFDSSYVQVEFPVLAARLRELQAQAERADQNDEKVDPGPECAKNELCRGLGITGLCCPTPEGVLLGCCDSQQTSNSSVTAHMQDEWRGLLYCDLAVVNREVAWNHIRTMQGFGSGGSRANSLYWAATRPAPVPGFNASNTQSALSQLGSSACTANSACDALGMVGECCPEGKGAVRLQCCPALEEAN